MTVVVRLVIAFVIAAAVALVLSQLIGPVLVELHAPFISDLGRFLEGAISYLFGFLVGAFWFFGAGKSFTFGGAA